MFRHKHSQAVHGLWHVRDYKKSLPATDRFSLPVLHLHLERCWVGKGFRPEHHWPTRYPDSVLPPCAKVLLLACNVWVSSVICRAGNNLPLRIWGFAWSTYAMVPPHLYIFSVCNRASPISGWAGRRKGPLRWLPYNAWWLFCCLSAWCTLLRSGNSPPPPGSCPALELL